jgi:hypothetical protein
VDDDEGPFLAAQRNARLDSFSPPSANSAKVLVTLFRKLILADNRALRDQVTALNQEQRELKASIDENEAVLNDRLYALYELDEAERPMIEQG